MNKLLRLLLAILLSCNAYSQSFAPIGATWHYTNREGANTPNTGYVKIVSEKDTLIQGLTYRKLTKTQFETTGTVSSLSNEFLHISGDTVFRLSTNDTNYVLYNFDATTGDTWTTRTWGYTQGMYILNEIVVDSITSSTINGNTLKTLYVSSTDPNTGMSFGGVIKERLGCTTYMFQQNYGLRDTDLKQGLRCYSDNIFGSYNSGTASNCNELITAISENIDNLSTILYPNPTSSEIRISSISNEYNSITLFNASGKVVLKRKLQSEIIRIKLSEYGKGIYFYQLSGKNDTYGKLIIQ